MVIEMFTEFSKRMDEHSENVNRDRKYKYQMEVTELTNN